MCWYFEISIAKLDELQQLREPISENKIKINNTLLRKIDTINKIRLNYTFLGKIDTIAKLLKFYNASDLPIPKQLFDDYSKYPDTDIYGVDKDLCLCPVSSNTLGNDKLTQAIRNNLGEFIFLCSDNNYVYYRYGINPIIFNKYKILDLNPNSIFHALILKYVVKQKLILKIEYW